MVCNSVILGMSIYS